MDLFKQPAEGAERLLEAAATGDAGSCAIP